MKLSTTTLFDQQINFSSIENMKRCNQIGFEVLDMNFCNIIRGKGEFIYDNWEEQAYAIKNEAEKIGVTFGQSHLPYHPLGTPINLPGNTSYMDMVREMTIRAVNISGVLGVKWAVLHPYYCIDETRYSVGDNIFLNIEEFSPVIEQAKKVGVGIAFENLVGVHPPMRRRFCAIAEDLIALTDAFNDECVQVCWDFGHANLIYRKDQTIPLRMIGNRLKATHVDENAGNFDAHLLPYMGGNINWEEIMHVLAEIGYQENFTYEIHSYINNLPTEELKDEAAKLAFDVGNYLISLAV